MAFTPLPRAIILRSLSALGGNLECVSLDIRVNGRTLGVEGEPEAIVIEFIIDDLDRARRATDIEAESCVALEEVARDDRGADELRIELDSVKPSGCAKTSPLDAKVLLRSVTLV